MPLTCLRYQPRSFLFRELGYITIRPVSEKTAILSFLGPSEGPLFVGPEMFRFKGECTVMDEPLTAENGEVRTHTQTDRQTAAPDPPFSNQVGWKRVISPSRHFPIFTAHMGRQKINNNLSPGSNKTQSRSINKARQYSFIFWGLFNDDLNSSDNKAWNGRTIK